MWRIPQLRWGISLRRRLTLLVGLGLAADPDCLLTRNAKQLDRSGPPEISLAFEVSGSQPVLMARHAESEPISDTNTQTQIHGLTTNHPYGIVQGDWHVSPDRVSASGQGLACFKRSRQAEAWHRRASFRVSAGYFLDYPA